MTVITVNGINDSAFLSSDQFEISPQNRTNFLEGRFEALYKKGFGTDFL